MDLAVGGRPGAEVKVCVLKVPHTLRPRQLSVTLEPLLHQR